MEQQIRFCTASDGVSIAYATVGDGPPLVYTNGWPTHLELEWEKPFSRAFLEALAEGCTLHRYDMRGSGLSDPDVTDFSLESLTKDLEAVIDHQKLERFALASLGSLASPIAITYAATHPERVSHLILSSAFFRGAQITSPDRQRVLIEYVSAFGFPYNFVAQDVDAQRDVQQLGKAAASGKMQAALLTTMYSVDVSNRLDRLTMPILVMHGRSDGQIPFALGRELAAQLPDAKFVPFEGSGASAWTVSHIIIPELHRFLGINVATQEAETAASRDLVTIFFTDVEASSALTERLGDAAARDVLRSHERTVRDALKEHGGSEVKTMGDGFMASFSSTSRALECAITMQRKFAEQNKSVDEPVRVRIGLNAGEPIAEDDDLFGTAVNLAARIAAQAQGGQILASDVVRQLVAGKGFLFADRGESALRGFEEPVRVYEVGWEG